MSRAAGTQGVYSGGAAYYAYVESGGGQYVYSGGLAYEPFVYAGSFQEIFAGGKTDYAYVYAGAYQYNYGSAYGDYIYGTAYTEYGGVNSASTIESGGVQYVWSKPITTPSIATAIDMTITAASPTKRPTTEASTFTARPTTPTLRAASTRTSLGPARPITPPSRAAAASTCIAAASPTSHLLRRRDSRKSLLAEKQIRLRVPWRIYQYNYGSAYGDYIYGTAFTEVGGVDFASYIESGGVPVRLRRRLLRRHRALRRAVRRERRPRLREHRLRLPERLRHGRLHVR